MALTFSGTAWYHPPRAAGPRPPARAARGTFPHVTSDARSASSGEAADASSTRRGIAFVMTGASGVGKDTIRRAAVPALGELFYSVSATTRERRPGEEHGVQYYFLDRPRFERMIDENGLLEWAEYVGDYYGTPRAPVERTLAEGRDVLLELELAGARQVRRALPDAVMIFIAPPSLAELERRLRGRGTDDEVKVQKRLARAREEIRAVREFDYAIVNDRLDTAVRDFRAVVQAERVRAARLAAPEIAAFLRER
jgi:guanylate kinase